MIKAVSFDLGNTLLRQDNIDWKKLEKAGFLNHISVFSKQNLEHPTLKEWSGLYERVVAVFEKTAGKHHHEIPAERIFQIMHEYYNIPASISTATLLSTFFIPLMNARLLMDHVKDVLQELRDTRIQCGVISNTVVPGNLAREVLERLEILNYFDFTLFSSDCIFAKPHPLMFEIAAGKWNLKPFQILHVGDQLDKDVKGAHEAGLRTVWINHDRKKIKAGKIKPDHEIFSLDELRAVINKIDRIK
jgi:putative hydrolase of the HAD superfamily